MEITSKGLIFENLMTNLWSWAPGYYTAQ